MEDETAGEKNLSISSINFDEMWRNVRKELTFGRKNKLSKEFWNKKSQYYDDADYGERNRVQSIIDYLGVNRETTMIDVGCGTGKITIPLAKAAKHVTAIDQSPGMIEKTNERASSEGIHNITCINKKWEGIEPGTDVQQHDFVMASYSLTMPNIRESLLKMHDCALKGVFLAWWAGDHNMGFDKIWKEMFGKPYQAPPDYIYLINILHQAKIYPDIKIIQGEAVHYYTDMDAAFNKWIGDLGVESEPHQSQLEEHLKNIIEQEDGILFSRHPICTALLWWFKE